jgi:uncharacterized protein YbbK (DUF523 family)
LGINCRHDGKIKPNKKIIELAKKEKLIPVCPDVLGGLSIPREQMEIIDGKVIMKSGKDATGNCVKGAQKVLEIAQNKGIKEAILKQRAPSCGSGKIYDGTFSGKVIKGWGITADLLRKNGIKVISEEEI